MSETLEKKFPVTLPARLNLSNIRGSVEIRPSDDGFIQVTTTKQPHTGDEKRTEIEITQEADGTVKAATRFTDGWNWLFGSQPCVVDYKVTAPRHCSIKVNGVSNTVLAEGFEGDTTVNSVSGEITIRDLRGSVRIHTVSGDADGERITGSLDLDTVSGNMTLLDSVLSSIKGNTVSGDMQIRTPLTEGPYYFKSVSGQVRLTVPANSHCTAELHSVSGDLVSTFPITGASRHRGNQAVNVQGGGVKISLHSVSGDLSLECDEEIPAVAELVKTTSSEERRSVLERVERGELTVDEALGQLHK